jgi:hypothetical protein
MGGPGSGRRPGGAGKGNEIASRISKNLGGPSDLKYPSNKVKSKKDIAKLEERIRRNLNPHPTNPYRIKR